VTDTSTSPEPNGYLSAKNYALVKKLSLYLLPALGAAYFGLAAIWGLPKAEEVVGSIVVLETLIGVVIRISNSRYEASGDKYDGQVLLTPDLENGITDMAVTFKPESVAKKGELLMKVKDA